MVNVASGKVHERRFAPTDWEPGEFPPIPEIVAKDEGSDEVPDFMAPQVPQPYLEPRRTILGDSLVETRDGIEKSRLTVWNWRTGEEKFRRDFAGWAREIGEGVAGEPG